MNSRENSELKKIGEHVSKLNEEVGVLQNDIRWIKKIGFYLAGAVSIGLGKVLFFG